MSQRVTTPPPSPCPGFRSNQPINRELIFKLFACEPVLLKMNLKDQSVLAPSLSNIERKKQANCLQLLAAFSFFFFLPTNYILPLNKSLLVVAFYFPQHFQHRCCRGPPAASVSFRPSLIAPRLKLRPPHCGGGGNYGRHITAPDLYADGKTDLSCEWATGQFRRAAVGSVPSVADLALTFIFYPHRVQLGLLCRAF